MIVENLKTLKYHIFLIKSISAICSKCGSNDEIIFKEEESIEILKTFSLIDNIEE